MSEYQFYEFKAIDKPLSEKDKNEIGNWSSRTNPSNTGATFIYSYGSFPKDEIKVVEKYFDAMFYIANWGTTQLVFKLPNNLIDIRQIKQYCIMEGFDVIEKPDSTLLDICISDDEGGGKWIEGEGWLSTLALKSVSVTRSVGAGPKDTTTSTVDPAGTLAPPTGSWLITISNTTTAS